MTSKVIIVTGANVGIGYAAAQSLCEGGNDVILACRNEEKGKLAVEQIVKQNPKALATFMQVNINGNEDKSQLDLADLASVRKFVDDFHRTGKKLKVLINNAGLVTPKGKQWTKDNFEMMMGTNHLGHFLLTHLLLDDLKKTASEEGESRIVVVSSLVHDTEIKLGPKVALLSVEDFFLDKEGAFTNMQGYKNSKLCNVLMTHSLSKQLEGSNVTCNSVCPGFVKDSEFGRENGWLLKFVVKYILAPMLKFRNITPVHTLEEAGRCLVELAVKEEYKGVSGKFFSDYVERKPSAESLGEDLQKRVYDLSARYCHMSGYEPLDVPPPPNKA